MAPRSDLYLIKVTNCMWSENPWGQRTFKYPTVTSQALREATAHIEEVVRARNLQGKAVLSVSWGKGQCTQPYLFPLTFMMQRSKRHQE